MATDALKVGDPAPDFTLPSENGDLVTLSAFRGKSNVVLFFYPKNDTPICTAEACSFRDNYQAFQEAGAEVLGISSDSVASHGRFATKHHLPFRVLSDADGALRTLYRVPRTLGLLPGRVTYLIDKSGTIQHIFSSQFQASKHVDEALRVLRTLPA